MLAVAVIHIFPSDSGMALLLLIFILSYWVLFHTSIATGRAVGRVWLGLREDAATSGFPALHSDTYVTGKE